MGACSLNMRGVLNFALRLCPSFNGAFCLFLGGHSGVIAARVKEGGRMADVQLKRLSRIELIDIIYELQKQNQAAADEIERLRRELDERQLSLANAGSIAEAAVSVNGVFEAAQAAADQYLLSIRAAEADAQIALARAEQRAKSLTLEAQRQAAEILRKAQCEAQGSFDGGES